MGFGDFFDEPKFDFDKERKSFVDNLNLLKTMSVQEQTLYTKWLEFNSNETTRQKFIGNYQKADIL